MIENTEMTGPENQAFLAAVNERVDAIMPALQGVPTSIGIGAMVAIIMGQARHENHPIEVRKQIVSFMFENALEAADAVGMNDIELITIIMQRDMAGSQTPVVAADVQKAVADMVGSMLN